MIEHKVYWQWTNWAFGFWWIPKKLRRQRKLRVGLEFGPLQIIWRKV